MIYEHIHSVEFVEIREINKKLDKLKHKTFTTHIIIYDKNGEAKEITLFSDEPISFLINNKEPKKVK